MRKLIALFILIGVFFPLAFAAMTLTAVRPWVLDRGFYEGIANDERLYEALLTNDLPRRFNHDAFTEDEQLPLEALRIALGDVLTVDYLRAQSLNVIDQVFDYFEGRERDFELDWDISPIKAALIGEGRSRFATALAAELPDCAPGQDAVAPGGSLTRCISDDGSVEAAAAQIAAALPAVLENTPDHIVLNDDTPYVRMNWYDFGLLPGSSVVAALDIAMLMTVVTALAVGIVGAFLGGDDLRGRLKWFSSALFFPGSLFLAAGLVMASPLIVGPISSGLASSRWGTQYSESFREAVADVIVPVVQQIGSGFVLTGIVVSLIALAVLIWSGATPAQGQRSSKMVQVPARNP